MDFNQGHHRRVDWTPDDFHGDDLIGKDEPQRKAGYRERSGAEGARTAMTYRTGNG